MGKAAWFFTFVWSVLTFTILGPSIGGVGFLIVLGIPKGEFLLVPSALALVVPLSYVLAGPAALAAGVIFGIVSIPWRFGRARSVRGGGVILGAFCGAVGWALWALVMGFGVSQGGWGHILFFGLSGFAGGLCGALLARRWPARHGAQTDASARPHTDFPGGVGNPRCGMVADEGNNRGEERP